MASLFKQEAELMMAYIIAVSFMAFTILFFLMKGKEDKRPYGWVVAHLFFSMASLVWALRSLRPRLLSMNFNRWH
ncbi:hypothetical protein [Halobacillus faecis]|uniref:Uncharacterized protein n=1 Tax=Halobacillus faecis TaxID=360184 RepID=A0A511WMU3_9BACI|nr:hypothetical protein [Halobacillus faecis]GEN52454.1 hypothetical protein HFA01_07160 [Halobacillus faecis]